MLFGVICYNSSMDPSQIGFKLLLSFILGAVIGLEREINEKKTTNPHKAPWAVLGIRSFSLITVLGTIVGFMYAGSAPLALLIAAAFMALLLIFYYLNSTSTGDIGITTEIAVMYCFVIGALVATDLFPIQITIALTVVAMLLLSQKERIKSVVSDIQHKELNALISYALLAAVVLPFLPNESFSLSDMGGLYGFLSNVGLPIDTVSSIDIINPFKTWLVLVLVTGVDLISYILGRVIGEKRGWLLTSIIGGFVSSTATTQSVAQQSKETSRTNHLVGAAIAANLASFFQIAFLIGLVNGAFVSQLGMVLLCMIAVSGALLFYFLKSDEKPERNANQDLKTKPTQILDVPGALRFTGLYLLISILSKIALSVFGNTGLLVATGIGSLIGLDAVMVNTAQLAGSRIPFELAATAFIVANGVNLAAKSVYSYVLGSREFTMKFGLSMAAIVAASAVGLILF